MRISFCKRARQFQIFTYLQKLCRIRRLKYTVPSRLFRVKSCRINFFALPKIGLVPVIWNKIEIPPVSLYIFYTYMRIFRDALSIFPWFRFCIKNIDDVVSYRYIFLEHRDRLKKKSYISLSLEIRAVDRRGGVVCVDRKYNFRKISGSIFYCHYSDDGELHIFIIL